METKQERLKKEAAFQDSRESSNFEERMRFTYLIERARGLFWTKLNNVTNKRVLVPGCGTGMVTPLARKGCSVVGIDISPLAIEKLQSAIKNEGLSDFADARCGDAENPDFPADSFDLICCSGVFHHLDVETALNSWTKILKKDGSLIMLEPNKLNPFAAIYRIFTPDQHSEDEHPLSLKDYKYIKQYFSEVKVTPINFLTPISVIWVYLPNVFNLKNISTKILSVLDSLIFKLIPFSKYFAWSTVIECRYPTTKNG